MNTLSTDHLPYGIARPHRGAPRVVARLGRDAVDLHALLGDSVFAAPTLNAFLALGREAWTDARGRLREVVAGGVPDRARLALDDIELLLPFAVADYVDFFSSRHHAERVGRLLRPDGDPLTPNWLHLPLGYHGRAGTVVVDGTPVRRPCGQVLGEDGAPEHVPTRALDVELELGYVVGTPSTHGEPVAVDRALEHLFGVVLLNDWSARDIQSWESRPLGPFLGKAFQTSIAAWVTPLEALAPYRVPAAAQEPTPQQHLREDAWAYDIDLEVVRNRAVVARSSARHLHWSPAQQVAHLTSGGASLRTGDLLGTGTISGPEHDESGSLLELGGGFLDDGDEVALRGRTPDGAVVLGEVRGRVVP